MGVFSSLQAISLLEETMGERGKYIVSLVHGNKSSDNINEKVNPIITISSNTKFN